MSSGVTNVRAGATRPNVVTRSHPAHSRVAEDETLDMREGSGAKVSLCSHARADENQGGVGAVWSRLARLCE